MIRKINIKYIFMTPEMQAEQILDAVYRMNRKSIADFIVRMIISANPHSNPFNTSPEPTTEYWEEVKNNINKKHSSL